MIRFALEIKSSITDPRVADEFVIQLMQELEYITMNERQQYLDVLQLFRM